MNDHIQTLENRRLLAADAVLDEGVLTVTGTNGREAINVIQTTQHLADDTREVDDGTTSVGLDFETLEAAAGLALAGLDGTVEPAEGPFAAGFDIIAASDFRYTTDGELLGGTIRHTGTLTFDLVGSDGQVTIGDFDIGFDASRATDGNTGLFVADTVGSLGILFDIGAPDSLAAGDATLDVGRADLNVSPEFAAFLSGAGLASSDLTGATVGAARVDALGVAQVPTILVNRLAPFQRPAFFDFDAELVDDVVIDSGGGRDSVNVLNLEVENLSIDTGNGRDRVLLLRNTVAGDTTIDLGGGRDLVFAFRNTFAGSVTLDGGRGRDTFIDILNDFSEEPVLISIR
jgi:hypothetical protein